MTLASKHQERDLIDNQSVGLCRRLDFGLVCVVIHGVWCRSISSCSRHQFCDCWLWCPLWPVGAFLLFFFKFRMQPTVWHGEDIKDSPHHKPCATQGVCKLTLTGHHCLMLIPFSFFWNQTMQVILIIKCQSVIDWGRDPHRSCAVDIDVSQMNAAAAPPLFALSSQGFIEQKDPSSPAWSVNS